eukprot:358553-Chlamydomonas_euryale.AAC.5
MLELHAAYRRPSAGHFSFIFSTAAALVVIELKLAQAPSRCGIGRLTLSGPLCWLAGWLAGWLAEDML